MDAAVLGGNELAGDVLASSDLASSSVSPCTKRSKIRG
jgi:hypothetical protein